MTYTDNLKGDTFLEKLHASSRASANDMADIILLKEALKSYSDFSYYEQLMVEALVEADWMSFVEAVDQVEEDNPCCLVVEDFSSDDDAYDTLGRYMVEDLDLFCDQLTRPRDLRGMWIGDYIDYTAVGRDLCLSGDVSEYDAINDEKVFYWSRY